MVFFFLIFWFCSLYSSSDKANVLNTQEEHFQTQNSKLSSRNSTHSQVIKQQLIRGAVPQLSRQKAACRSRQRVSRERKRKHLFFLWPCRNDTPPPNPPFVLIWSSLGFQSHFRIGNRPAPICLPDSSGSGLAHQDLSVVHGEEKGGAAERER